MFIDCEIIYTGTSEQVEKFTYPRGKWKKRCYPATIFKLEHEVYGTVLIDTGYSDHLKTDVPNLVYQLYRLAVNPKVFSHELSTDKSKQSINHLLISHFHPDHIADLKEYTSANVYCSDEIVHLQNEMRLKQYRQGFFPKFIDEKQTYTFYESQNKVTLYPDIQGFETGYDVFGDQSCLAVRTPGHALGHYSFFIRFSGLSEYVCIACDVAWHIEAIYENVLPHRVTGLFTDYGTMVTTVKQFQYLHQQKPSMPIVLTHCEHSHNLLQEVLKK